MCTKNIMDTRMPRKDNEDKLMGPPIIELEFQKDILDPHMIIGGEERPTLCERSLQFGQPKKYCRSDRELCTNCAKHL